MTQNPYERLQSTNRLIDYIADHGEDLPAVARLHELVDGGIYLITEFVCSANSLRRLKACALDASRKLSVARTEAKPPSFCIDYMIALGALAETVRLDGTKSADFGESYITQSLAFTQFDQEWIASLAYDLGSLVSKIQRLESEVRDLASKLRALAMSEMIRVTGGKPVEDLTDLYHGAGCRCHAVTNPPCSFCESGGDDSNDSDGDGDGDSAGDGA